MFTQKQTFAAAGIWEFSIPGSMLVLMDTTYGVNIRLYRGGVMLDLGEIKSVLAGLEVKLDGDIDGIAFDRVQIDVQAGDTVQVGVGNGQARYNRAVGSVQVTNTNGSLTNTNATVTNASTQILAAKANRRYLLIQNKDAAANVWISFGVAATTANGVKIPAGGSFVAEVFSTSQAIFAIGDTASNANVVTVEG